MKERGKWKIYKYYQVALKNAILSRIELRTKNEKIFLINEVKASNKIQYPFMTKNLEELE
jgi:hypothetical protein